MANVHEVLAAIQETDNALESPASAGLCSCPARYIACAVDAGAREHARARRPLRRDAPPRGRMRRPPASCRVAVETTWPSCTAKIGVRTRGTRRAHRVARREHARGDRSTPSRARDAAQARSSTASAGRECAKVARKSSLDSRGFQDVRAERARRAGRAASRMVERKTAWLSGGGGIRTLGRVSPSTVFKTAPFDRSGTPPCRSLKPILDLFCLELVGLGKAVDNARAVEGLERVVEQRAVEQVLVDGGGDLRARVP
jgi:hypothetical protein